MNTNNAPTGPTKLSAIEQERDHLRDGLAAVAGVIDRYSDVVEADSSVRELQEIAKSVADYTQELLQDARLLRLGIVGQVKAGKSSLLNLLLFDGQEVLPKAATPMTASLTHIIKSDRDEVEIEYYTHEEWREIGDHAREYQRAKQAGDRTIPKSLEAAAHLVEKAAEKRTDVDEHLGQRAVHSAQKAQLNERLRRFVGTDGDLTPLVKSVAIRSSQGLPDLDIVDTPGINDPIASRSRQADKMLGGCDAVLMLSYAGQFMDKPDVAFFERRVPQEGIRHRIVIGSKLDSALVDVARDHRGLLDQAKDDTIHRLHGLGREALARDHDAESDHSRPRIILMSAMCAALADRPYLSWSPEDRHAFETLQRAYPDYLDLPEGEQDVSQATRDKLREIGNRGAVDECLQEVRDKKDNIIAQKMGGFLREKRRQALKELGELIGNLQGRRAAVESRDVKDIERQQGAVAAVREELEVDVTSLWTDLISGQGEHIGRLRQDVRTEAAEARQSIKEATTTEVRRGERKRRGFWAGVSRFFNMGGYEGYTYETKVLDQGELENGIVEFYEYIRDRIGHLAGKMYSRSFAWNAVKVLRSTVADVFSNEVAAQVDLDAVQASLREAVMRVVAESRERLEHVRDSLFGTTEMSFQYEGDSIEYGQRKARESVKQALEVVDKWIDSCSEQVGVVADRAKADLMPTAVTELERYQARLKEEVARKGFTLQRYSRALDELGQAQRHLTPGGG